MTPSREGPGDPGCRDDTRELLSFYLNGSLTPVEEAAVRAHLDACASCSAELDELAALASAIEAHGAELPPTARRPRWGRLLVAAALLVAATAAVWWTLERPRNGGAPGARAGGEVLVDLAAGTLRDGGGRPEAVLAATTGTVVASLFPPVRPGALYEVTVVDAQDRTVVSPAPLGPLDEVGRATVRIPAAALPHSGVYRVVLAVRTPPDALRTVEYAFEVRRSEEPR